MPLFERVAVCLAALLLVVASAAASSTDLAIPTAPDAGEDGYPAYSVTFANGVVGIPAITYSQPSHYRPITLDIYMPKRRGTKRPLVVYVHGGAWVAGTPRGKTVLGGWPEILAALSARGYVVAAVSYRLDGEAHFPAAIQDVKTAIRFLRKNSDRFGIDPGRAAIWGPSAGGQLAALAAVSCGVTEFVRSTDVVDPRPGRYARRCVTDPGV
jgi:acetyl esterase/lipase